MREFFSLSKTANSRLVRVLNMCVSVEGFLGELAHRDLLHNTHDGGLDAKLSRVVIFLFGFAALAVALNFVTAADDADFDLDKFSLEAFVEEELIGRLYILGHRLFDQDARLGCYGK